MKVHKVFLYLLGLPLLLSLIQVGFADLAREEKPYKLKSSHFKCQIMKDQGLSRYDKIILLQLIHRKANVETQRILSEMNEIRCQKMHLQVIIGAASTGGRAIGIPPLDPVIHLVGIHWARSYDFTKSQEDTRLWFGWGRVMRRYQ